MLRSCEKQSEGNRPIYCQAIDIVSQCGKQTDDTHAEIIAFLMAKSCLNRPARQ